MDVAIKYSIYGSINIAYVFFLHHIRTHLSLSIKRLGRIYYYTFFSNIHFGNIIQKERGPTMNVIDLIISIGLTAITYLLFPLLIIIFKLQFKKLSHVIIFTTINALIIYIFFSFLWFLLEGSANASTAGFWGLFSFMLLKKYAFSKNADVAKQTNNNDAIKNLTTDSSALDPDSAFVTGVFMDCFSKGTDIIERDSFSKSKTKNYFIIEFHFLLHCTFAGIVTSKDVDFSYERLIKIFSITLVPYAKKLWGNDYLTIVEPLLSKRFSDYEKVFFNDYCPIDLLEITEHSPENKFARAFALFVDFCCYYHFSKEIANIEDFSCIPVFDLFETIPLRTLFANLSHVHSHYCDLLCEHYK
ncbi:hypothetical protein [[Clostridium] symbiosum]|uniref:hypothetical protein n=1 Tax=Clostridium symbiosum TaxID=1512 RepID=UPI0036F1CB90